MTTKNKIMMGFGGMIAIILVIAVLGYRTLGESLDGYEEYGRYSRINVNLSDILTAFNAAGLALNRFLDAYEATHITTGQKDMDEMDRLIGDTIKDVKEPQRLETAQVIRKKALAYKENMTVVMTAFKHMQDLVVGKIEPAVTAAEAASALMLQTGRKENNGALLALIGLWESQTSDLRYATANFLSTRSEKDAKSILDTLALVKPTVSQMRGTIRGGATLEIYNKQAAACGIWFDTLPAVVEAGRAANAALAGMQTARTGLIKELDAFNDLYDTEMNTVGPAI